MMVFSLNKNFLFFLSYLYRLHLNTQYVLMSVKYLLLTIAVVPTTSKQASS